MNQWFGEPWPRADYRAMGCEDDRFRIPTPVGSPCMHCGEPIGKDDQGTAFPGFINGDGKFEATPLYEHLDCAARHVRGCPARLMGEPCHHSAPYREQARQVQELLRRYPGL